MKRFMTVAALVVGIALLVALLLRGDPTPPSESATVPAEPSASHARAAEATTGAPARVLESRPTSAERGEPSSRDGSAALPRGVGHVRGRVVDESGVATGPATLLIRSRPTSSRPKVPRGPAMSVGDTGRFEVALSPGTWDFVVTDHAPWEGHRLPWSEPSESFAEGEPVDGFARVKVEENEAAEVVIRVQRPGSVEGTVVDPHGQPVEGAMVRVDDATPRRLVFDSRTDAAGRFRVDWVYPGACRVSADVAADSSANRFARPVPVEVVVRPGTTAGALLAFREGPCTIRGAVLDETGRPFGGVPVLVYERRFGWGFGTSRPTHADDRGRYEVEGLPAEEIVVQAGVKGYVGTDPAVERSIARFAEPISVDLRSAARTTEVPDAIVRRSHSFRVEGTITLDESWAKTRGVTIDRVDVRVAPDRSTAADERPRIEADGAFAGRFSWTCEPPRDPVAVVISCRERGVEREDRVPPVRRVLTVVPDRVETLSVRFP